MISGIYQIECNGKVYIGSSNHIDRRWKEHIYLLDRNAHPNNYLQNTYNRYGLNSFVFTVLEECSINELLDREQHYLDIVFSCGNTYNIAKNASSGMLGRNHTIDAKNKIAKAQTGKVRTEEHKKALNWQGKNHTDDTKLKMSKAHVGNVHTDISKAKMSESHIGRVYKKRGTPTEQTKQRISEGHARRRSMKESSL